MPEFDREAIETTLASLPSADWDYIASGDGNGTHFGFGMPSGQGYPYRTAFRIWFEPDEQEGEHCKRIVTMSKFCAAAPAALQACLKEIERLQEENNRMAERLHDVVSQQGEIDRLQEQVADAYERGYQQGRNDAQEYFKGETYQRAEIVYDEGDE